MEAAEQASRTHICPKCGSSGEIYREESESKFLDALMWIFRRYPYLCRTCDERFYDRSISGRQE
jgi:hypothetical protein